MTLFIIYDRYVKKEQSKMIIGSFIIFKILINTIIWHDNLILEMKYNPSDNNKQSEIIKQYTFIIKKYLT